MTKPVSLDAEEIPFKAASFRGKEFRIRGMTHDEMQLMGRFAKGDMEPVDVLRETMVLVRAVTIGLDDDDLGKLQLPQMLKILELACSPEAIQAFRPFTPRKAGNPWPSSAGGRFKH